HFFKGKILVAEEKWGPAETELQKTLQLDPNFGGAYDLLVQTYLVTNKLPQALSQLQTQLSKNPNDASALMTLALLHERTNEFAKARDAYEHLLSLKPDLVSALNNLACLYADRLNDLGKAYDLARKARDLQGNDPAIADTFGWILSKRGEYQQALAILQGSAAKLPDSPEVQFHLGMTAYMMGQPDLARVALQKAASATNDFPGKEESKRHLALLKNDAAAAPELSVSQLEAMAKKQPNDVIAQTRLGEAYEKQGAADKAAAAFEQVLKLNPRLASATTKVAQLYAGPLQNKEKALATGSDFPKAADARTFLSLTALDENLKELVAAENGIQKELQASPEYLPALMAQAALDEQRGQIMPASEIYTSILRRSPDFA